MVLPYIRAYQQSQGWPTINETTCPEGEWKWVDRWGKQPRYNWLAYMSVAWVPFASMFAYYCFHRYNVIREEERNVLAEYFAEHPNESELEAEIDEIYQSFKRSKLNENSASSKFKELLNKYVPRKEQMTYTKTDVLRVLKDDG